MLMNCLATSMQREKGTCSNGVLEGLTFNKDYSALYTNVEEPS
jgi:hypothetical protein